MVAGHAVGQDLDPESSTCPSQTWRSEGPDPYVLKTHTSRPTLEPKYTSTCLCKQISGITLPFAVGKPWPLSQLYC